MSQKKEKTEKSLNIYQRINAVMAEVEYIQKADKAAKGLPYKFVSHDQVTGKLHGPMQKHGIVMVSDVVELKQDGNRTEVKLAVSFINMDDPQDRFTVHYWGYGVDNQDKGIGKAISYAVKYCLLKTFCLETGDDVERDNIDHAPAAQLPITDEQLQSLELLINGHDDIRSQILKHVKGDLRNITQGNFNACINWVNSLISQKKGSNE